VAGRWISYWTILSLAIGELFGISGAAAANSEPALTICIYNYAAVKQKDLVRAETVSAGIFRDAGIDTQWLDVPVNSEFPQNSAAKGELVDLSQIQLNLLPQQMADKFSLASDKLGFVAGRGTDRKQAFVFLNKVENLVREQIQDYRLREISRWARVEVILGYVIAHEVGHLLGIDSHSPSGIMRAEWTSTELPDAANRFWRFTPEQTEIIRAEVKRRIARHETLKAAGSTPVP
jgi:hypothetical protein